jgi:hypothetical protein
LGHRAGNVRVEAVNILGEESKFWFKALIDLNIFYLKTKGKSNWGMMGYGNIAGWMVANGYRDGSGSSNKDA